MAKYPSKVPVGMRALLLRVNRLLFLENAQVGVTKAGTMAREELGRFYLVKDGKVAKGNIDLAAVARDKGCLKEFEELADED